LYRNQKPKIMNRFLKQLLVFSLFAFVMQIGFSQETFQLQANPKLEVSGTSSLHDWEMPSNEATGKMEAVVENGKLSEIKSIEVKMPAESIKSGKKAMDKKAYEALKTKKNKFVIFNLKNARKSGENWILDGEFEIAGKTKSVSINTVETSASGSYGLKGELEFKMTDFDMKPPTAMMGAVKAGDEVKITFDVKFK